MLLYTTRVDYLSRFLLKNTKTHFSQSFILRDVYCKGDVFCFEISLDPINSAFATSGLRQYINCKILLGGTFLQPWTNAFGMRKYFSEDYVIPSPKSHEHQKNKVFAGSLKCSFAKIRWRLKKKVFAGNCSGFSPKLNKELSLFCLIIQRLNLYGVHLNLDGVR